MSASKTAEAARKAVEAGEKRNKKSEVKTPEQIVADVRNLLASKLAVPPDSTRVLLTAYDELLKTNSVLDADLAAAGERIVILLGEIRTVREVVAEPIKVHPHEIDRFHDDGGPVFEGVPVEDNAQ